MEMTDNGLQMLIEPMSGFGSQTDKCSASRMSKLKGPPRW